MEAVPVCPHAGGVGLCEHVQHLALWDYVSVAATLENRCRTPVASRHVMAAAACWSLWTTCTSTFCTPW